MRRLKTPGIVTAEEYHRAERAGRFTITDEIFCSYCQAPVEVRDPLEFHCSKHGRLELKMYSNPGYPAVENETHGTMMFHFGIRPPHSSISTEGLSVHRIAKNKGCPFCNRNLSPEVKTRGMVLLRAYDDKRPDDLIEKKLSCPDCEIDFWIHLVTNASYRDTQRYLQLQPEPGHLDFNVNVLPGIRKNTDVNQEIHVDPDVENDVETIDEHLLPSRHASQHTDVKGKIQAYFRKRKVSVAKTEDLLQAIGCSRVSLNNALKKLIDAGETRKIQKGYYEYLNRETLRI